MLGHNSNDGSRRCKRADLTPFVALVPDPFEQIILARLLDGDLSAAAGVTCNEAARRLNAAGIQTKNAGQPMQRQPKGQPKREWVCDGKWRGGTVESIRRTGRKAA